MFGKFKKQRPVQLDGAREGKAGRRDWRGRAEGPLSWGLLITVRGLGLPEHGECGEVLSRETREDLLRNLVPGRQCTLHKCELSILFCHRLVWHPKTPLPHHSKP